MSSGGMPSPLLLVRSNHCPRANSLGVDPYGYPEPRASHSLLRAYSSRSLTVWGCPRLSDPPANWACEIGGIPHGRAAHIGFEVGLASSTVQQILNRAGVGRLDRGDRATDTTRPNRYQRDLPGELIHVDIKKIAGIPDGGGWRTRGRGYAGEKSKHRRVGYRYIHTAIDDRSRIAYSEIHDDEQAVTAAGFWARAAAWYHEIGIHPQRVITDNGSCYRSGLWHRACAATGTKVKKTRPYRPQTNGKVERFHRILLEEWAYIRAWTSETQRADAYTGFIHFYNHHRSHGSLGWATPTSIIKDNLPALHT